METKIKKETRANSYLCGLCFKPVESWDHKFKVQRADLDQPVLEHVHADCILDPYNYYTLRKWGMSQRMIRKLNRGARIVRAMAWVIVIGVLVLAFLGVVFLSYSIKSIF